MPNGNGLDDCKFQFLDEDRKFAIAVNAIPAGFGPKQSAGNPAQILIAALPGSVKSFV